MSAFIVSFLVLGGLLAATFFGWLLLYKSNVLHEKGTAFRQNYKTVFDRYAIQRWLSSLVLVLVMLIILFSWVWYTPTEKEPERKAQAGNTKLMPITIQTQEPPPVEEIETTVYEEIEEEIPEEEEEEKEPVEDAVYVDAGLDDLNEGEDISEPEDNTVYNWLKDKAKFPGGDRAMMEFVAKNFDTRKIREGENYRFYVFFVVEKDGSISDVSIPPNVKNVPDRILNEALRVVSKFPKFDPASNNGVPARMRIQVPFVAKHL